MRKEDDHPAGGGPEATVSRPYTVDAGQTDRAPQQRATRTRRSRESICTGLSDDVGRKKLAVHRRHEPGVLRAVRSEFCSLPHLLEDLEREARVALWICVCRLDADTRSTQFVFNYCYCRKAALNAGRSFLRRHNRQTGEGTAPGQTATGDAAGERPLPSGSRQLPCEQFRQGRLRRSGSPDGADPQRICPGGRQDEI